MKSLWRIFASIIIASTTVIWTVCLIRLLTWFAYQYGWWSVIALILFGMLLLNIVYLILALPSLLIFFIKERSRKLNLYISLIYSVGLILSLITPWTVISININIPNIVIAIILDILMFIFYKRKIFELYKPD